MLAIPSIIMPRPLGWNFSLIDVHETLVIDFRALLFVSLCCEIPCFLMLLLFVLPLSFIVVLSLTWPN